MNTPRSGRDGSPRAPGGCPARTVGTLEHWSCGLAGLVATAAVVLVGYPVLVWLVRPLQLLSTTALLLLLVGVWLITWLALELAWEWRAGRLALPEEFTGR
jgi:hypothetical protein